MTTETADTLVMIRTKCCESFKCGNRCAICPNRPENREAARRFQAQMAEHPLPSRATAEVVPAVSRPFSRIRSCSPSPSVSQ